VSSGSGSNLKLPLYLAAGLPVVTTPVGLRGFERLAGWLTVAELDQFAAAVRAPKPLPCGIRGELTAWSWSTLGRRLHGVYEQTVAEHRKGRRLRQLALTVETTQTVAAPVVD
jgi:hypothetical protein